MSIALPTKKRQHMGWLILWLGAVAAPVQAYVVGIAAGPRSLYLQVGSGTFTGGNFNAGGVPGNNTTINSVLVTVPTASVGSGSQAMATDSTVSNSALDGFSFCTVPAQVYVGGFYRSPGAASVATLSSTSPPNLTSGPDVVPFTSVSWVSGGNSDPVATIASGTFNGATQTLYSAAQNSWFESCLSFNYANNVVPPAGTFTGRVVYTLSAP